MRASPTANIAVSEPISAPCTTIPRVGPHTTSLRTISTMAGMAQVTHRHSGPGAAVEQQQAHDGHQTEDLLGPVRGLAEEDHERRRGADEKCPPGYSGPRLRRREPAQRALTVVAPRPCSPSNPHTTSSHLRGEPRCSAGPLLVA